MSVNSPVSGNRGFIGLIMMMGLTTIAAMGLLSSTYQKRQIQLNSENKLYIDVLQQNFSMYIQDDESWKKTLNDPHNTSFACILSGTSCSRSPQPINILRNAKGEIVVDTAYNKGILPDGTLCDGYQPQSTTVTDNTNTKCNLHVNLEWKPICKGACISPAVIQVNVGFDKGAGTGTASRFIASSAAGIIRKPTSMPNATSVGVGFGHTCALAEGEVYCWGSSWDGRIGPASTGGNFLTPVKVTGIPRGVTKLDVGQSSACAIQGGNIYCWGTGYGSTPQKINKLGGGPLPNVIDISVGVNHSCAIDSNYAAWCWGADNAGQLGYQVPATVTYDFWGFNTWSGPNGPAFPVNGLSRTINGPELGPVTSISAELGKTCAVVSGAVMCWGGNESRGGVGDLSYPGYRLLAYEPLDYSSGPPYAPTAKGYKVCYPYTLPGTLMPDAPGDGYGNYVPGGGVTPYGANLCNPKPERTDYPLLLDSNVKQIVSGYTSTCALKTNGDIVCWGYYDYGALARPSPDPTGGAPQLVATINGVEALGRHASGFFALKGGKLYAWGHNRATNTLGDPNGAWVAPFWGSVWVPFEVTGVPGVVTSVQGGAPDDGAHMCAVANAKVYCWGGNNWGQLGDGTTTNKTMGNPTPVMNWP